MLKKFISLILVSFILISCFCVIAHADARNYTFLRAGGGSSGGGSGGGGSSGGSSHHSHTTNHNNGGEASPLMAIFHFAVPLALISGSSLVFYFKLSKRSRNAKKLINKINQSDNAWKYKDISARINDSFIAIQTAWTNMDMSSASQYMSAELLDSFQTKLNWMACRSQRNVLKNIKLQKALPVAVHDDAENSRDCIWFYIKGKMVDYIIDTNTQLIVSGKTTSASFVEYWQFVKKEDDWVLNKILQKDESNQIPFSE